MASVLRCTIVRAAVALSPGRRHQLEKCQIAAVLMQAVPHVAAAPSHVAHSRERSNPVSAAWPLLFWSASLSDKRCLSAQSGVDCRQPCGQAAEYYECALACSVPCESASNGSRASTRSRSRSEKQVPTWSGRRSEAGLSVWLAAQVLRQSTVRVGLHPTRLCDDAFWGKEDTRRSATN